MSFRDAFVLRAAALWTVLIWSFRLRNILGDDHPAGFKLVHAALGLVSIAFALAVWAVAAKNRRGQERPVERQEERSR